MALHRRDGGPDEELTIGPLFARDVEARSVPRYRLADGPMDPDSAIPLNPRGL